MSEVMQGFPSSQPNQVTLANWRTAPYCHWAFHHVREIVPSAEIKNNPADVWSLKSGSFNPDKIHLDEAIIQTDTDALVILHNDEIAYETYRNGMTARDPHILMSVSKSMLGLVAGTLIERNEIKEEDLVKCIRKGTLNFSFVPVLTGSAFKNKGVQPLLDAVVNYLPSPVDIGSIKGTKVGSEDEIEMKFDDGSSFSGLAFKVANDPFVGSLTFVRIYSGTIKSGTAVYNSSSDKEERVGRMLLMHANSREDIKEANAGDIVSLAGLKNTMTGHTLCDKENPVLLEPMEFPDPVIEIAVEPKTKGDQEKMGEALARLAKEDPSFRVSSDEESGQTIIKGMGELHLDIIVDRMKREFKVEANVGAPQVAYRETIEKSAEYEYIHKKQSGGAGQFAKVKLFVEPQEPGKGREVESAIKGGAIPKEFIPGVEKGIETVSDSGILAGFPMIDYKVTIVDGLHHDVDSSVLAFELASRACFKEACTQGGLKLLEPIMRVEVVTPEDYMGDVIGDLNSRRGQISTQEQRGNATVITAMVPLANMFGYINNLRSMSQGRAQYSMFFDHYSKVPQNVQDEVTKKVAG